MDLKTKEEIYEIINILSRTALFDNDGVLVGYFKESWTNKEYKLLKKKNKLIKENVMSQKGFEIMMFNYIEAPSNLDRLDRIPFSFSHSKYLV